MLYNSDNFVIILSQVLLTVKHEVNQSMLKEIESKYILMLYLSKCNINLTLLIITNH